MHIIAPSILNADFSKLGSEIDMLNASKADWVHLDIMDGSFVPNISFGIPIVEAVRKKTDKILDAHLMIVNPDKYIERFAHAGANYITVHYEACPVLEKVLGQIRAAGCKTGVALNPDTPVKVLEPFIRSIDMVLIMSVNPGFGGQSFIPETIDKVAKARELIHREGQDVLIEVDGGVNPENGKQLLQAGADVLVAGSLVFNASDPMQVIDVLKDMHSNGIS